MDIKDKIIATATDLFMKHGYRGTSTRQIANLLKITQPAIYHHFKNKEVIYEAVLLKFAVDVGVVLNTIASEDKSKQEILTNMALFLKKHHPINFSLMMNDIHNELSKETEMNIFIIWKENYFAPFIHYFDSIRNYLHQDLDAQTVSMHFLRVLSAYIMDNDSTEVIQSIFLEDMVHIFLRGITRQDSYSALLK